MTLAVQGRMPGLNAWVGKGLWQAWFSAQEV